ncbi:MAG TPA: histidinol dehydrogenase [Limnochordales bacterium]
MRIFRYATMTPEEKKEIFGRARADIEGVREVVAQLIRDVRERGDQAIVEQVARFDKVELTPDRFRVSDAEIEEAFATVDPVLIDTIKEQIHWSTKFHEAQKTDKQWFMELEKGVIAGQITRPIPSVAIYVPGGLASYPTTTQILTVPARVAGVPRICVFTPPKNMVPEIIIAAKLAGAHEIYRIGGVAAIAAAAYGTETIPRVDKIVGPGNVYVQAAKMLVYGQVAIDMPAGPSEAIMLADETARPEWCAADILARAEHDPNAAGVLVTHVEELAYATAREVERQAAVTPRKEIVLESLRRYSCIIITDSLEESIAVTNEYAPEHLELLVADPFGILPRIEHAGSVFLGHYAPVAVGDYASGVNHTLPTGGWARVFSPIGVDTFQKKIEFEYLTPEGLGRLKHIVYRISAVEKLPAHADSVKHRFGEYDRLEKSQ